MKKLTPLIIALCVLAYSALGQTTVTITCTGSSGSYKSGSVNSTGTKNDGNMITINSSANRGWANYDLSTIPVGSIVSSVVANFTTYSSTSSTANNNLYGFTGDPSTMTGTALYTACGSGTAFETSSWTANATLSKTLNATGIAFIQANCGGNVNIGYVRGSTNTYNIYGYPGTTPPNLVITYSVPTACTGNPDPGNTLASVNPVCPGATFSLSLQNNPTVTGLSYQWQSSPDGSAWTNFGTNLPTQVVSQTAATYYQCIVTCSGSGLSTTSNPVNVTMNMFYNCYCVSQATSTADEDLFNVTLGTLNNSSTCLTTGGPGSILNEYSNYCSLVAAPEIQQGAIVPISLTSGTCGGNYSNSFKVFIDFNQNGLLTDAGEQVYVTSTVTSGPHTETGNITIPGSALLGTTLMRVIVSETGTPSSITACGTYSWGETEDYLVKIIAPVSPLFSATPLSLSFGYVASGSTSTEQSYSISGVNLTGSPVVVTAPAGFGVSLTSGGPYVSSLNIPFTPPTLAATTVYVVFAPTSPVAYSGNITNVGGGATIDISVAGYSDPYLRYCTSMASNTADEEIYSVTVNGVSNAYDCFTVAPGPGSILNRFSNFTTLGPKFTFTQGVSAPFTVEENECDGATFYLNGCAIWIDWNQDGDFLDADEQVYSESATTISPRNITGNIAVPATAPTGNTYMRVTVAEGFSGASLTPCLAYGYGETEDYMVTVQVATTPYLTAAPGSIAYGYVAVGNTSLEQTIALNGGLLTPAAGDIVVTAPTGFLVSTTSGSGYAGSVNVPYTGGAVSATVYAVFQPTVSGDYTGNITFVGGGANASVAVTGTTNITYCTASATTCDEYIGEVILNDIDNVTACTSGGYADYSSLTTQLNKGVTYVMSVINPVPYSSDQCGVWIDWNSNGVFTDAGEQATVSVVTTGALWTANITPPMSAIETSVRMRVRVMYTGTLAPCGNTSYGETEDYTIKVNPPLGWDAAVLSIDNLATPVTSGTYTPKATVVNNGLNTATFTVTMTSVPAGYTSVRTVTGLTTGTTQQVTFDDWTATPGVTTMTATVSLALDENSTNDSKSLTITVFEAGAGTWGTGSSFPTTTYLGTGVGYTDNSVSPSEGYLFSIGGNTTSALGTECYKYTTSTDTWTAIASLPAGRRVLASAIVGSNIYAIAGSDMASVYQSTVYKYDILTDSWSTVASMPIAVGWAKAVAHGTNIYVAGGVSTASVVLADVYVYNTLTDTWATATSMPSGKFGGAFSCTGDMLVYAAGADLTNMLTSVFVGTINTSDPTIITWNTAKSSFPGLPVSVSSNNGNIKAEDISKSVPIPPSKAGYPGGGMYRFDAAPWGTDGVIMTAGSPSATWLPAVPSPCFVYKPATDSWIKHPDLPVPVLGPSLGSVDINNAGTHTWKLIVASGIDASGVTVSTTQILSEIFAANKTLNVKLLLEGLAQDRGLGAPPAGTMFESYDESGMHWGAGIADKLTIELRNSGTGALVYSISNATLSTSGNITVSVPAVHNGSYYIYIKHRNSITTSSQIVSFAGASITYDFTTGASQAYGSNESTVGGYSYIYAGDENQDGLVDSSDLNDCDNDSALFAAGYLVTDVNGDGLVDSSDMNIIDNNNAGFIAVILPF